MKTENSVVFKGRNNGITIVLDKSVKFEIIKKTLKEKIRDAQGFFDNAKSAISFSGRELSEEEEAQLLEIISSTANLSISFFTNEGEEKMFAAKEAVKKKSVDEFIKADENITIFHRGSLRSGQSIRFAGSVVVIGDVNPGAEIVAEGNVIVMGSVKGLVHAGCGGNEKCCISAISLQPTQLRISDIISFIPKEIISKNKDMPSYAYAEDGQIYVMLLNS